MKDELTEREGALVGLAVETLCSELVKFLDEYGKIPTVSILDRLTAGGGAKELENIEQLINLLVNGDSKKVYEFLQGLRTL